MSFETLDTQYLWQHDDELAWRSSKEAASVAIEGTNGCKDSL